MRHNKNNHNNQYNLNNVHYQVEREIAMFARPVAPIRLPRLTRVPRVSLLQYEDRRTFHPDGRLRRVIALPQRAARIVTKDKRNVSQQSGRSYYRPLSTKAVLAFAAPSRVAVCVRRHRRREVLFASRRTGKGAYARKHLTDLSKISCR